MQSNSLLTQQLGVLTPFMYQRWLDEEKHIIINSNTNTDPPRIPVATPAIGVVVPNDHDDTLFWCLYIAKNGYDEYRKYFDVMRERKKNFEMEIKSSIMQDMSRNQHALLSRKSSTEYKFTKKQLCEIFSSMMVIGCRTCMYTCLAICRSFEMGMFLVDANKKLYLSMNVSPHQESKRSEGGGEGDGEGGGEDGEDGEDRCTFFVVYKRPRGTFGVDVTARTQYASDEIRQKIVREYVEVTMGGKPLRPITAYKKDELLELCRKIGPVFYAENRLKTKKKEDIYMALWEYMKWDMVDN